MNPNGHAFRFHDLQIPARIKELAHHLIPGGCHTYAKGDDQYPILAPGFIARGLGCRVWDTDGREYIEYGMGNRTVGLGHAYPPVLEAVQQELSRGANFTRPSPIEVACAEQFLALIDGAEMVKFCKDGSDATSGAVRLARAYTGRDLIAICADHPFFSTDDWFIGTTPMNAGIPEAVRQLTVTFRYNDLASAETLFEQYPGRIAAFILEPARTEEPQEGYLQRLQGLCHANGALLILDEMITGFRWHKGGAQKVYGIVPDLSAFGKALANGFSVSALAGRREFMRLGGLDHDDRPRVFLLSTTHGAETHALAAAIATMQVYQREGVIEHLYRQGTRVRQLAEEAIRRHGLTRVRPRSWADPAAFPTPPWTRRANPPRRSGRCSCKRRSGAAFSCRRSWSAIPTPTRTSTSRWRRLTKRSPSIGGRSTMGSIAISSAGRRRRFTGATIVPRNLPGYGTFPWQPRAEAIRGRRPMAA